MNRPKISLFVALIFVTIIISCSKGSSGSTPTPTPIVDPPVTIPPALTLTSFTPTIASVGSTVTITGTGFGTNLAAVTVKFGTAPSVNPSNITSTQINVVVPDNATNGPITVGVNNVSYAVSTIAFTIAVNAPIDPIDYSTYNKIAFSGTATLSEARAQFAAAGIGNRILIAGGTTQFVNNRSSIAASGYSKTVDIYNTSTGAWKTSQLSEARCFLAGAAAGNKVVFAGGFGSAGYSKTVDIYDVTTDTWTTAQLSIARCALTATAYDGKIYIAGGVNANNDLARSVIDIYDVGSNTWSVKQLSAGSSGLGAAAAGGKIAFVGGSNNVADVYIASTFDRDNAHIVGNKTHCVGAGLGNKILFAGDDNIIDILNTSTANTWTATSLSVTKAECGVAAAGTKILFAGGIDQSGGVTVLYKNVDIFDVVSNTWSALQLSEARNSVDGASAADKILFAGGNTATGISKTVDIFTISK